jgi:cytochrome b
MNETNPSRVLVWDWPVRAFHGGFALLFVLAYALGDSERWRNVHVALGYGVLALIAFRILWGLVGTRPARFAAFLRGPGAVARYLAGVVRGQPAAHTGHNPAGGWAIVALLGLGAATGISGWLRYQDLGGERMEDLHELLAGAWLGLVVIHIAAVVLSSVLHRENLPLAMLTGRKRGLDSEGATRSHALVAAGLVAAVGLVIGWAAAIAPGSAGADAPAAVAPAARKDED